MNLHRGCGGDALGVREKVKGDDVLGGFEP